MKRGMILAVLTTVTWAQAAPVFRQTKWEIVRVFESDADAAVTVRLSSDGRRALIPSWNHVAAVWNAETGKKIRFFGEFAGARSIRDLQMSGDGRRVLIVSKSKKATLRDVDTGKVIFDFRGHKGPIEYACLSYDGKRILTGEGGYDRVRRREGPTTTILWDADTGRRLQIFRGEADSSNFLSLSGDGNRVLTRSGRAATLWDSRTGKQIHVFRGHTSQIRSVCLSGDGKRVLTGSHDKTAILWDADTGKQIRVFKGHPGSVWEVQLSGDGKRALTISFSLRPVIRTAILWDADTGEQLRIFGGKSDRIDAVHLNGDGKRLLVRSGQTTRLWVEQPTTRTDLPGVASAKRESTTSPSRAAPAATMTTSLPAEHQKAEPSTPEAQQQAAAPANRFQRLPWLLAATIVLFLLSGFTLLVYVCVRRGGKANKRIGLRRVPV